MGEGYYAWYYLDKNGNKIWHNVDDLPSYINDIGEMVWQRHGLYHRENGPSVIYKYTITNFLSKDGRDLVYCYNGQTLGSTSSGYTKEKFDNFKKYLAFI